VGDYKFEVRFFSDKSTQPDRYCVKQCKTLGAAKSAKTKWEKKGASYTAEVRPLN